LELRGDPRLRESQKVLDRAVEVAPDTFTIRELRGRVEFYQKDDLEPMRQLLANWPENVDPNGTITLARYNYFLYARRLPRAAPDSRAQPGAKIPRRTRRFRRRI
jgi:hypothetical protein